jgi:site-specific DNA-methyltransferase (adenine-specific)
MPISTVECCDCMDFMAKFPDKFFDLAIVDPPYGIGRFEKPSGNTRFNSSKMMQESGLIWDKKPTESYWKELFRISENQIIWGANNFKLPESEYFCVWDKLQTVNNFASAELAYVSMGLKKPAKVFRYSIHKHNQQDKIHPTQKPVALYVWLLQNYAKPGDKILDTHMGSQSSRIAAYQMGFDFWGCEIDPEYFEQGCKRFEKEASQQALFTPETTTEEQNKLFKEATS